MISEEKKKIVIENYFKSECNINTTIHDAYVKGFERGLSKAPQPERKTGRWILNDNGTWSCDKCHSWIPDEQHYYAEYCLFCGAKMELEHGHR